MSIKIGLLGFGTVASGIPFLLKENGEKVLASHVNLQIPDTCFLYPRLAESIGQTEVLQTHEAISL